MDKYRRHLPAHSGIDSNDRRPVCSRRLSSPASASASSSRPGTWGCYLRHDLTSSLDDLEMAELTSALVSSKESQRPGQDLAWAPRRLTVSTVKNQPLTWCRLRTSCKCSYTGLDRTKSFSMLPHECAVHLTEISGTVKASVSRANTLPRDNLQKIYHSATAPWMPVPGPGPLRPTRSRKALSITHDDRPRHDRQKGKR